MSIRTSHNVAKTVKKSGGNGRGGVCRWVYGPSLGKSVELGASNGAGGGNADALGKFIADIGVRGEELTSVVADDAKVVPLVVVSIEGCEA